MKIVWTSAHETTIEPAAIATSIAFVAPLLECDCTMAMTTAPRLTTAAVSSTRSARGRVGSSRAASREVASASSGQIFTQTNDT